ncbi:penicillin-binding transpeptidase domain-containing protein [uncultured Granulicatella sp.]|uniref:peptidoglycan D,D-transpeptidase FtsI family protein n=1 Tax=uncultured Granulicatella sp. TaxID=316089 RepID=UPI0028D7E2C9|nr:penicillin-binding transpeptidase domain-containing protein [uncultured Granulicatella sp.]
MIKKHFKEYLGNRKIAIRCLMAIAIFLFLIFSFYFFKIMVLGQSHGVNLRDELDKKLTHTTLLKAKRGNIYDASGSPIAVDATNYSLFAVLTDQWDKEKKDYVQDFSKTAQVLSKYIDMKASEIEKILSQKNVAQVEFGKAGKNLSVETKEKIEKEELPGIKFTENLSRYYPNGIFASHLIGYTEVEEQEVDGKNVEQLVGKMGIEALYNATLTGKPGEVVSRTDGNGYVIPGSEKITEQPKDGNDLYLTLDKKLQTYLESLVSQVTEKYLPNQLTAMLVDPKTGNIVAATQRPTFNGTTKEGINTMWNNLLMDEAYEPGSTMKVLALAAAINEGVFDPNEKYESGKIQIFKDLIRDYNKVGWGRITYLEGLAHSSNVAFVHVVQKIGVEKWKQYLDLFGFGQSTQSGFLNESTGLNSYNSYLQQLTTGFGQGISVTAFQMVQAFTAIANQGEMKKLRIVDHEFRPATNTTINFSENSLGQVIKPETAKKTLEYLREATTMKNGTSNGFDIEGEEVAAKTGTAELVNPETGKYYSYGSNYIYSVIGFAPASNPKYILYITLKQPQNNPYGDGASAIIKEIFNPMMKRALDYSRLTQ